MAENVELVYANRFAGAEELRSRVWSVLTRYFFQRWVRASDTVLDLGAGYCEFINNIQAARKYAVDLNPATAARAGRDVQAIIHDVSAALPLEAESVDVIFSSNFLEHLPTKDRLEFCLQESHRVLRSSGRLLLLGPNIRCCPDIYWDFFDHHLPLSDRSVVEALELHGFEAVKVVPRFLPFTTKSKAPSHPLLVRLYLALPIAWRFMGKQFFIAAQKV
jgi:SAM-dependent methyltransferase